MSEMTLVLPQAPQRADAPCETSACVRQQRWNIVALFGIAGGLIGNLLGLFLTVLNAFLGSGVEGHIFGTLGTTLLLVSLPLLLLGGHGLDQAAAAGKEYDR